MEEKARKLLERIEEIEARAAKATPGPWKLETHIVEPEGSSQVIRCGDRVDCWNNESCANAEFIAHAREDVPWLCETVRQLIARLGAVEAQNAAMREALETFLMAYDPSWPGACPQECFDTSDGHGYEMQEVAKDKARRILQSNAGRDLLEHLHKLEAVAKAAREYLHDIDAPLRNEPTIYQYEPWEDKSWRLRQALAALEAGPEGKDDAG